MPVPVVREMPEEEFYPSVRDAAINALSKIEGTGLKLNAFARL